MTTIVTAVSASTENLIEISSLTCDAAGGTPTTISPSGAITTVVLTSRIDGSLNPAGFVLSSSFLVGDTVEVHDRDGNSGIVFDENGNQLNVAKGLGVGILFRKVATGTGHTWSKIG